MMRCERLATKKETVRVGRSTMPEAGRGTLRGAGAARRAAVERSGTVGRREPPTVWPVACCGRRMRVLTSHESGWRGICRRRALVASCVMLPRVFPEGTSREGGTPDLSGEEPGLDAALQHEVTCSQRLADPVTARRDVFAVRSLDPF
jgi:hypothetical protein